MYHLETKIKGQGENITLNNTAETPFEIFKVEGNSVQKTRSGKNKFNINNLNVISEISDKNFDTSSFKLSNAWASSIMYNHNIIKDIEPATQYKCIADVTLISKPSGELASANNHGNILILYNFSTREQIAILKVASTTEKNNWEEGTTKSLKVSFTTPENLEGFSILGYTYYVKESTEERSFKIENMMILKETEQNEDFEAYGASPSTDYPSTIKNVEGSIGITVCNKNIFNKNNYNILSANLNNGIINRNEKEKILYFKCNKNTTYSFTKKRGKKYIRYVIAETIKKPAFGVEIYNNKNTINETFSYTTSNTAEYIVFWFYNTDSDLTLQEILDSIQIEINPSATAYTEHQSQTITFPLSEEQKLRKGDYLADDGIHHVRKQVELDGTENWFTSTLNDYQWFGLNLAGIKIYSEFICTHLKNYSEIGNYIGISNSRNANRIYLSISEEITTVEQLKSYLAQQKENGTPVIVEYDLAEEEIEPYTKEQQEAYRQIKSLYSYNEVTNIFSNNETSPIFNVSTYKIITEEIKQRILNGKITRAYLKVLATDTKPEIKIDESNYLKDLTFEELRYVPEEGFIGGTVAKRVTGNFNNVDSSFTIQDREFELYMGVDLEDETTEYIKYGTYIVQKPEDNQVTDNTSFEALDYMVKLNLPWEDRMTYPCTLKELFYDLVDQSGLSAKVQSFLNEDFIVENNQFEEGTTRRDVLKAIAQMAFNWARIDENNNIVMDFEKKDDIEETLDYDKYYDFSKQEVYGPINVIVLKNSQVEGENVTIKDEESISAQKGKNMIAVIRETLTTNGITFTNNNDGSVTINGTATGVAYFPMNEQIFTVENGKTYGLYLGGTTNGLNMAVRRISVNTSIFMLSKAQESIISTYNGETVDDAYAYLRVEVGTVLNNVTVYPMLVEGSKIGEYEPFIPNGETELVIADNPLAYNQAKRAALIEAGKSLFGLKYTPLSMSSIGYMYLNCKDKIRVTNFNDESFDTYLLNHTIEYTGTISDSMEAPASTKTETKYQFTSSIMQTLKRTELIVDKANQQIQQIVEEQTNFSNKISDLTVGLNEITGEVKSFYDFTKEVSGINEILLEDALNMNIIKFEAKAKTIRGIYPRQDLYPSPNLYPKKGGTTITLVFGRTSRDVVPEPILPSKTLYPSSTLYPRSNGYYKSEFEFYISNPLRNYLNLNDRFIVELNQETGICTVKVIRYLDVDEQGQYIVLDTPQEEIIEERHLPLFEGNNYVYIKEVRDWDISATYVFNNQLNKDYALRVETNSKIKTVADEINLEVSKKVDQNEVIASINLSPEEIKILAKNLQLEGFTSINGNFTIDEEGNMICNNATIKGTTIANGENFSVDEEGNMTCKSATMENVTCENFTIKNSTIQEGYIELKSTGGNSSFSVIDTSNDRINSELSAMMLNFNSNEIRSACMLGIIQNTGAGFVSVEGDIDCNVLHQNSLESIKKNIEKFSGGLELVKESDIYTYNFKVEDDTNKKHIGFVIGDNYKTPDEVLGQKGTNIELYSMISILWNAVQEQQKQIENIEGGI